MDKLAAMETFIAIVDCGSLSAAAKQRGKALPTIVRTLSLLEESLGVRLLQRTTRRMSLTAEGRTYLSRCRRIVAEVVEAESELDQSEAELSGQIRITAPVLFGSLKVAPLVFQFMQQHPKVTVDLVLLNRVVDLVEEGFDVGVRIARLSDSSMIAVKVGEVRKLVAASPRLIRRRRPKHPRDLAQLPTVTLNGGSTDGKHWKFREGRRVLTVSLVSRFSCNQVQMGIDAAIHGVGYGRFLSYQIEKPLEEGALVPVLERFEDEPVPVQVVFGHQRLAARNRALVDFLTRELGDQNT